jgi:hypothetical protein
VRGFLVYRLALEFSLQAGIPHRLLISRRGRDTSTTPIFK